MGNKKTTQDFCTELQKINTKITVLGEYISGNKGILCKCDVCGHIWSPFPSNLLRGTGCPVCKRNIKKSHQSFVSEMKEINPSIILLGKYINAKTSISCKCAICGHEWNAYPNNLVRGHGCSKCAKKVQIKTQEEFEKQLSEINPNIKALGKYIKGKTPIRFKCLVCGYEWDTAPINVLSGTSCQKCQHARVGIKQRKKPELFYSEMKEINSNIDFLSEYIKASSPIKCRCKKCEKIWFSTPNNLLRGQGCPKCAKAGTSFMEQFIYSALEICLGNTPVVSRDRKEIGMELDIYIPDYRIAIEPGSWVFHKETVQRDNERITRCKNSNIKLITIFDSYNENEMPKQENCLVFPYDLGSEKNHKTLKSIVIPAILSTIGIERTITADEWKQITRVAQNNTSALGPESFRTRIESLIPTVEVKGDYINEKTPVLCRCKICGHEWNAFPTNLMKGRGCFECNGNKKKTPKQFRDELHIINPFIDLKEDYKSATKPVLCQCKKCGHVWKAYPNNLLRGHGCSNCYNNVRASKQRKTTEEFVEQLRRINPTIVVIGKYLNDRTPIECKCEKCGRIWNPLPTNLLRGHGCNCKK